MRTATIAALLVFSLLARATISQASAAADLGEPNFSALSARCAPGVHVRTMASLARHESALNPFAIHVNGGFQLSHQPVTEGEAIATARQLLDAGANIDVGLGQINSENFSKMGLSLSTLFGPCENLGAAAQVLSDCYQRSSSVFGPGQAALRAALSCYNTGTFTRGVHNGYVAEVVAQAALPVPEILPWSTPEGAEAQRTLFKVRHRRLSAARSDQAVTSDIAEGDIFTKDGDQDAFSNVQSKRLAGASLSAP